MKSIPSWRNRRHLNWSARDVCKAMMAIWLFMFVVSIILFQFVRPPSKVCASDSDLPRNDTVPAGEKILVLNTTPVSEFCFLGLSYELHRDNSTADIKGLCKEEEKGVEFVSEISVDPDHNYSVTRIMANAFHDENLKPRNEHKPLTIPSPITIESNAFKGANFFCQTLVVNAKNIGSNAFTQSIFKAENDDGRSIKIASKEVEDGAFSKITTLVHLEINGFSVITSGMFFGLTNLETLKIGESVTTIKNNAFVRSPYLKEIQFAGTNDVGEGGDVFDFQKEEVKVKVICKYNSTSFCQLNVWNYCPTRTFIVSMDCCLGIKWFILLVI